jgi:hypothetical protein
MSSLTFKGIPRPRSDHDCACKYAGHNYRRVLADRVARKCLTSSNSASESCVPVWYSRPAFL